ncbi:MAG: glycosyltransferase family 2 protein [Alphaproteobacteria bacterium]|nr:glycosyltransferase family 2 protein [Alphaproteobacteria bacterium]
MMKLSRRENLILVFAGNYSGHHHITHTEKEGFKMEDFGRKSFLPKGTFGFTVYTVLLIVLVSTLPAVALDPSSTQFILVVGGLAVWRYSWGLIHFTRSVIYHRYVFPKMRREVDSRIDELMPSHVYLLVTAFRIEAQTAGEVYAAAIREAINCGVPATIVASIVEMSDEIMFKQIFEMLDPPGHVKLQIVRIPGTGKRDGLAQGFRAISRDMPAPDAVVAVIDGDSILGEGLIRKCAPFFKYMPNLGALTTDEECHVKGSKIIREWHHLRFAQRQILMNSVALSKKVLTLTGRMSMFRAEIITDPDFIHDVQNDSIDHWRLGKFKFLTGDDKSSWYWVIKRGYDMLYIPDTVVMTVEHPPSPYFLRASTQLMFRWFGNMLRTNGRAVRLGPHRVGLFVWWCVVDQRISMWTSLAGPVFAIMLVIKHSVAFFPIYIAWIGFTRWIMTLMLLTSRPVLSWYYPFLIYYNQIWGSVIKTFVFFRLDQQSWTRQKTKLQRGMSGWQTKFVKFTSHYVYGIAMTVFVALVGFFSGVMEVPYWIFS